MLSTTFVSKHGYARYFVSYDESFVETTNSRGRLVRPLGAQQVTLVFPTVLRERCQEEHHGHYRTATHSLRTRVSFQISKELIIIYFSSAETVLIFFFFLFHVQTWRNPRWHREDRCAGTQSRALLQSLRDTRQRGRRVLHFQTSSQQTAHW